MKQTPAHLLTHSHLLSSTIAEDPNATLYSGAATYAANDEVYKDEAGEHKVYRSTQGSNTGNDPSTDDGTWWVEIGWTNRWRALTPSTGLATVADDATGIQWKLNITSTCTHVGLFGVKAASVTVLVEDESAVEIFNETQTATETVDGVSWYVDKLVFSDVGIEAGYDVTITIADTGVSGEVAQVSQVVIGRTVDLGDVNEGALSDTLEDFSRREQDTDGIFTTTVRGYAEMVTYAFSHAPEMTRWVKDRLVEQRSSPCMYWVDAASVDKGMMIFGYAQEPNTPADLGTCVTTVDVLGIAYQAPGLTALAAIEPNPPAAFVLADWSLASGGSDQLDVTISNVPTGTTDIKYLIATSGGGGPSWPPLPTAVSTGGIVSFSITGLSASTEYSVMIFAAGPGGTSDASDVKSATTNAGAQFADIVLEQDFSVTALSGAGTEFAVDAGVNEIVFYSSGMGSGQEIRVEVSTDGGSTWETTSYVQGYIRGSAAIALTASVSSLDLGFAGHTVASFFTGSGTPLNLNIGGDSSDPWFYGSIYSGSAITHWRLKGTVTAGYLKVVEHYI